MNEQGRLIAMTGRPNTGWAELLAAVIGQPNIGWMTRAACGNLGAGGDRFYPEKNAGGDTDDAKRMCQPCQVRGHCLAWALATDQRAGVWGGLSEQERRPLKRRGWKLGDPLPPIRFGPRRVVVHITRRKAEQMFKYATKHGSRWTAWHYGISRNSLYGAWDNHHLGRPNRRSRRPTTPTVRSLDWAQRTFNEAQQTSISRVARTHHVSHHTLTRTWDHHGLGNPTKKKAA